MRYVFMHNFRGFNETLLPLRQTTFLVGENSTGKSSFLKLLHAFSRPQFWFSLDAPFQDDAELGGFGDMVSAWAPDKSYFQVGTLTVNPPKSGRLTIGFTVHTFGNRDGSPYLSRYLQFADGNLTKLAFQRPRPKYKTMRLDPLISHEADIIEFFKQTVQADREDTVGFSLFPKAIPSDPPLPLALSVVNSIVERKPITRGSFSADIPFWGLDLTWIAPIRTRPKRFYDGMRKAFSPEGDHTPFLLRRSLRTKSKSRNFAEKLHNFGEASGLFETIVPHSLDKSPQSPFEIVVKFPGAALNVSNVGYGVSQVLPLVVEFLSTQKNRTFGVQQPEVHLHPRAQAALGDLICELTSDRGHSFVVETHSDYLIDRFRLHMSKQVSPTEAQVIFFSRTASGNSATVLPIGKDGRYPQQQPPGFRGFFVREEMMLLEV